MIRLLRAATWPDRLRFERALADPARAQDLLRRDLVKRIRDTEYGARFSLSPGASWEEFREKVPIVRYDDLRDWVDRQAGSPDRILTRDPVIFFERTSGSSGGSKLIPYTHALRSSFTRMFWRWMGDVLAQDYGFRRAKAWITVSPPSESAARKTSCGTPIGLSDDTEYLSPGLRGVVSRYLVLGQPDPGRDTGALAHFESVAKAVYRARDLEIISGWSPSYILRVLETIESTEGTQDWTRVWPSLKFVSCWGSAQARTGYERLQALLPQARFQPKGLLATEAPLTVPWTASGGSVPIPDEVLYEFEALDGRILGLSELVSGAEYSVIFSQKGGLTRYRIGDRVRVTGRYLNTPRLEFVGREGGVSDLVGEKLEELFVEGCLKRAGLRSFAILIACAGPAPCYRLVMEGTPSTGAKTGFTEGESLWHPLGDLAPRLEAELRGSPHYAYARDIGQLGELRIEPVANASRIYFDVLAKNGMKIGDIKERSLLPDSRLSDDFVRALGLKSR